MMNTLRTSLKMGKWSLPLYEQNTENDLGVFLNGMNTRKMLNGLSAREKSDNFTRDKGDL